MSFTDKDLRRLKEEVGDFDYDFDYYEGPIKGLIDRLEAAEAVLDTLPDLLAGHANLYCSVFSATSPDGKPLTVPGNDIVRRQTESAIEAWRKAAGR